MNLLLENSPYLVTSVAPDIDVKDQLVADIISLGVKAHRLTRRCIFVEFYGHVNMLKISIRKDGDDFGNELIACDIRLLPFDFYTDEEVVTYELQLMEVLEELKRCFQDAITHGDVDINRLRQITKRIY